MRWMHRMRCRMGWHQEMIGPDLHLYCAWCDWQDPWDDPLAEMIDRMQEEDTPTP